MIIIRMTGGLGNQMFQYALYLKLCSMGREVKFDDITEYELDNARPVMLWAFGLTYPRADQEEINKITDGFLKLSHRIRRKLFGRKSLEYQEKNCNYDPQVLQRDPAYLTGYFQSEKYFMDVEEQVRRAFTFSEGIWKGQDEEIRRKMQNFLGQIQGCESVSVHVRRGDYLEKEEIYGGICTEAYYKSAIEYMQRKRKESRFFLFSNDPEWVREWVNANYRGDNRFVIIEGTQEETGYLDLFLMSRCKNHIIANSSFSWWGAWLDENPRKRVIAPAKWANNQEFVDIYWEGMIKITAEGGLTG
ncbi:MAG: alpha-1,2-fucosyltransferase [Lachnospiraceae bacterium]|jgi:hypothetical protein|nr:alpha-1,2-fucosyltransferase [Lachnospiraceae bacterium]